MAQTVGSLVYDLDLNDKRLRPQLDRAEKDVKTFGSRVSSGLGHVVSGVMAVGKAFGAAGLAAAAASIPFIKSAADLQQTSKSFEVLTGNVDTANKLFAQLAVYANKTPFEFPQIAKAGQLLLGFGLKSEDIFKRVQMLGDVAAATGADFESLALVFGQVNATGRLMGQDALQLINNRIPITTIIAKKLGVTVQEVKKRMEDGAISTELFNEALEETTKKGGFAFEGTIKLAKTFNGRMSTLKDTVMDFGRRLLGVKIDPELGLVVEKGGVFDRLSNAVQFVSENIDDLIPILASVTRWFGKLWRDYLVPFGKAAFDVGRQVAEYLWPKLQNLWRAIKENLIPALKDVWDNYFKPLIPVIGTVLVAAIGFLIDAIAFLADNIDIIMPILAAWGALMVGSKVLGALNSVTLAIASQGGLKAALMNLGGWLKGATSPGGLLFTPWGAFAAVAVGAFVLINNAAKKTIEVMDKTADAINKASGSNQSALQLANKAWKEGRITTDAYKKIVLNNTTNQLPKRAMGGPVTRGRGYLVGERGPEMFVPNQSGQIVPNNSNTTVNIGTINDRQDADYILRRIDRNQQLVGMGMSQRAA